MEELVSDYSEKQDDVFTDMVLTVEGREFHVCKTTLATFSNYCKNIFFGNWSESKKTNQELPGVKAHQFQLALDFLYHKIEVTEENVADLLEVATYLQIKKIVKQCEKELCEMTPDGEHKLNLSNEEKFSLADHYALPNLVDHVLQNCNNLEVMETFVPRVTAELSASTAAKFMQRLNDLKKEKLERDRLDEMRRLYPNGPPGLERYHNNGRQENRDYSSSSGSDSDSWG